MPKYLIERDIPGAGRLTPKQLRNIAEKSNGVLDQLGPQIQWLHSYVTEDRITCVYIAPNEEIISEHAQKGEFPADHIRKVKAVIDPTTAEAADRAPA